MDQLTQLSEQAPLASEELLPMVYRELKHLAKARLSSNLPDHSLQPTLLVHEVYLRLCGKKIHWENRSHFFGAASEAMRRIVIEHYRKKQRLKWGGNYSRSCVEVENLAVEKPSSDILAIDEALTALEAVDSQKALLVKLRYFMGMTMEEAAEVLGVSKGTAERYWRYSRAWLGRRLST